MIDTDCNSFERVHVTELKDHELREMINEVTKLGRIYGNTQQLRERIAGVILSVLRPRRNKVVDVTDDSNPIIDIDDPIIKSVHYERGLVTDEEKQEISSLISDESFDDLKAFAKKLAGLHDPNVILRELIAMKHKTRADAVDRTIQLIKDK